MSRLSLMFACCVAVMPLMVRAARAQSPSRPADYRLTIQTPQTDQARLLPFEPTEAELRSLSRTTDVPLSSTQLSRGLLPRDAAAIALPQEDLLPEESRPWEDRTYAWAASEVWSHPLYFEDVMLERHGHARGQLVQPWISAGRFFTTLPLLPYKMQLDPPRTRFSALGHYRPGSWAPPVSQRPRFRWDAAAVQAATTTGLLYLTP